MTSPSLGPASKARRGRNSAVLSPESEGHDNLRSMTDTSESNSNLLKTGEVLERAGISRQVLYRYMQLELIQPAETTKTGRNRFRPSVFKQIELIQSLNQRYTLRDIREIFSDRLRGLS